MYVCMLSMCVCLSGASRSTPPRKSDFSWKINWNCWLWRDSKMTLPILCFLLVPPQTYIHTYIHTYCASGSLFNVCLSMYVCMLSMYVCMLSMYVCWACMYVCWACIVQGKRRQVQNHVACQGFCTYIHWNLTYIHTCSAISFLKGQILLNSVKY